MWQGGIIVAMPVKMLASDFHEFGDGQANAAPSWNGWSNSTPPLVAALVHFSGSPDKVFFRFDRMARKSRRLCGSGPQDLAPFASARPKCV